MATPIGPYSPSVRAGDFIIVSGQLGVVDGALVDGVTAQTTQAVANLADRLAEYGADLARFRKPCVFSPTCQPSASSTMPMSLHSAIIAQRDQLLESQRFL